MIFKSENENNVFDISKTLVAIYLFLLVFFVLLNTTNKLDSKNSNIAIHSFEKVFADKNLYNNKINTINNFLKYRDQQKKKYKQILEEIFSEILSKELELDSTNSNIIAKYSVSINSVFFYDSNILSNQGQELIKSLANLINNQSKQIRIEIIFSDKIETQNNLGNNFSNYDLFASKIVPIYTTMLSNLADESYFQIGMQNNETNKIIFTFYYLD